MADWNNRIVDYGVQPADQFLAHPMNARLHPQFQRDVMKAVLDTVGFVAPVIVAKSGYLLDGHERVWAALQNDNANIPFVTVDVTEEEEAYVLATFDPITSLATYEQQKLDDLLQDVNSDSEAVQQMLAGLATGYTLPTDNDWMSAFEDNGLNSNELNSVNITFVISKEFEQCIQDALVLFGDDKNKALVSMAKQCLNLS